MLRFIKHGFIEVMYSLKEVLLMHAKSQFPWAKFWKIARSNVSTVEEEEEELIVY